MHGVTLKATQFSRVNSNGSNQEIGISSKRTGQLIKNIKFQILFFFIRRFHFVLGLFCVPFSSGNRDHNSNYYKYFKPWNSPWQYDKVWRSSSAEILEEILIESQVAVNERLWSGIRQLNQAVHVSGTLTCLKTVWFWPLAEINNSHMSVVASGDAGSEILSLSIFDQFMFAHVKLYLYSVARTVYNKNNSRAGKIVRCNVEKCLQDSVVRQVISAQAQYTTIPTRDLELNI